MIKRALDLLIAVPGLVMTAPLWLPIALAIRLTSPGPAFFWQTRVGRDGQPFRILKFRTMFEGTQEKATHEVAQSQTTTVGRFLRRSKLDELPQLWNVVLGHMSLVGPRPCLPQQVALVSLRRRCGALAVRPGITGLAQVMGIDMSHPRRLAAVDALYCRQRSTCGDVLLILTTLRLMSPARVRLTKWRARGVKGAGK